VPREATRAAQRGETLHHWGTLIQTDARLELGASGGALVNLDGEMIGLTTALPALAGYERAGGFAVPVDDNFRRVVETLKAGRLPDYGFLGIDPASPTAQERQRGLFGARVNEVVAATPAAEAGLRVGDVITQIDEDPIFDRMDLFRHVSSLFADATVKLQVARGGTAQRPGRPMALTARLAKKHMAGNDIAFAEVERPRWRGLAIDYATAAPQFAERARQLDPAGSVAVIEVERDSPAWKAGLRGGDFVSHVGQTRVGRPNEFLDAVAGHAGEVLLRLTGQATPTKTVSVAAEEPAGEAAAAN
jgi:serine protease Do